MHRYMVYKMRWLLILGKSTLDFPDMHNAHCSLHRFYNAINSLSHVQNAYGFLFQQFICRAIANKIYKYSLRRNHSGISIKSNKIKAKVLDFQTKNVVVWKTGYKRSESVRQYEDFFIGQWMTVFFLKPGKRPCPEIGYSYRNMLY